MDIHRCVSALGWVAPPLASLGDLILRAGGLNCMESMKGKSSPHSHMSMIMVTRAGDICMSSSCSSMHIWGLFVKLQLTYPPLGT